MHSKMARKSTHDYRLVDDETGLKEALSELKAKLERNTILAVDCEGVSLSRNGALTIITVATEEKAYIFDVLKLGEAVFSSGLGEILEDKSREKLMFDCRQDSDALWHQFSVKLTGVLDLQLLEIIYRRENSGTCQSVYSKRGRRSQRTDEVENIYGFRKCLDLYLHDAESIRIKDKGSLAIKRDAEIWKKRPLSDELLQYGAVDTITMFGLYNKMKDVNGGEKARLQVASERYVGFYRGLTERSNDMYERNAYLPLDIIPEKGSLDFAPGNTECTGCRRKFPQDEFTGFQLSKGEQKCRVCREIKRRADERSRRW